MASEPSTPRATRIAGDAPSAPDAAFRTPSRDRGAWTPGQTPTGATPQTPDSVGRRRTQLEKRGDYWRGWRLILEYKALAAAEVPGFYALPDAGDPGSWHALFFVPPAVLQPSPYADCVLRLQFIFSDAFGDDSAPAHGSNSSPISVMMLSTPLYHPLVEPASGTFHFPPRLLPTDRAPSVVDLARIIRRAFTPAFLESLTDEDVRGGGHADALSLFQTDRATFEKVAQEAAQQSGSDEALFEAATTAEPGTLRVRNVKWDDKELDDAMDRLELAMEVSCFIVFTKFPICSHWTCSPRRNRKHLRSDPAQFSPRSGLSSGDREETTWWHLPSRKMTKTLSPRTCKKWAGI